MFTIKVPDNLTPSSTPYPFSYDIAQGASQPADPKSFTVTQPIIKIKVTDIIPAQGPIGTEVTIKGKNINYISNVKLGGKQCVLLDKTTTTFTIKVPDNLSLSFNDRVTYQFSYEFVPGFDARLDGEPGSFTVMYKKRVYPGPWGQPVPIKSDR